MIQPKWRGLPWALALLVAAAPFASAQQPPRPTSYDDFTTISSVGDFSKIVQGCPTQCTYRYFYLTPGIYVINNPIVIDRPTTIYLHGADKHGTYIMAQNQALPLFRVVNAPLVSIANVRFLPTGFDFSPVEARSIVFENTSTAEVEILDTTIDRGAIEIKGPGAYTIQNTNFVPVGMLSAGLIVDNPGADVLVIGGNMNNSHPAAAELCQGGGVCQAGGGPCTTSANCAVGDRCIAADPENCNIYHARQKRGRLRIYGTGVQGALGNADFRIETAASQGPHVVANVRSEGVKCMSDLPSGLVYVPTTTEAVDLLVMNNGGAWENTGDLCENLRGRSRFVEYNANGRLWLIGNNSLFGTGRLAQGVAGSNAKVVALGNRYFGNNDNNGADPTNLLTVTNAQTWDAGDLYSRAFFCEWCQQCQGGTNPGAQCTSGADCTGGGTCTFICTSTVCNGLTCVGGTNHGNACRVNAECPGGICGIKQVDFADPSATVQNDTPRLPEITIRQPLTRLPVPNPLPQMIDSADCAAGSCAPHYPDHCGSSPPFTDRCVLQGTLNKALADKKPAFIRSGSYIIDKPLYWLHKDQAAEDADFQQLTQQDIGGWIVAQNNAVTIQFQQGQKYCKFAGFPCTSPQQCPGPGIDACLFPPKTVFSTEGMGYGAIQGFTFQAAAYDGTCSNDPTISCVTSSDCPSGFCSSTVQSSTVEIENDPAVGFQQQQVSIYNSTFIGGRHALGLCVDSEIQCDTNMIVASTFRDAGIGFASGGFNALHNLLYGVTFIDNVIAMGADPTGAVGQAATWSVLHGDINGTKLKDLDFAGAVDSVLYFYDLKSDSKKILLENVNTGISFSFLFDHCDLNPSQGGNVVEYQHTNGPTFLYSKLQPGAVDLIPSLAVKHALKLGSYIPDWVPETGDQTRTYEWLTTVECPVEVACPAGSGCTEKQCTQSSTGADSCLSDASGEIVTAVCPVGQTLKVRTCQCKGGPACNGHTSTTRVCN